MSNYQGWCFKSQVTFLDAECFSLLFYITGISALAGLINAADMSLVLVGVSNWLWLLPSQTLKHSNYRFFCNMFLSTVFFFVFLLPLSQMRCTIQPANGGKIMLNSVFLPPLFMKFRVLTFLPLPTDFFPIQREMQRALFLLV